MMNGHYHELDLFSRQFIVHRWHTTVGREVRDRIITALKAGEEIAPILKDYVLVHPANVESYEFPYYPPDAINSLDFWLIADDDLRGIQFHSEDFHGSTAFTKLNVSYGTFSDCDFKEVNFDLMTMNKARFARCNFSDAILANSVANDTKLSECSFRDGVFLNSYFRDIDFSCSDLRGAYFEDAKFRNVEVDYITQIDLNLKTTWHDRTMDRMQLPDLYRSFRLAYERQELNALTDQYLMRERVALRKYVLFNKVKKFTSFMDGCIWLRELGWSLIAGYGTKPLRTVWFGIFLSTLFALFYVYMGIPGESGPPAHEYLSALYFSFTTFATLGYGDISYDATRPYMRLLTTVEAWLGAVMIALFVVVIARKIIRR